MTPLCTTLWRRLDAPSLEAFVLEPQGSGFRLGGTVVLELSGQSASVTYAVVVTSDWRTREVVVTLNQGNQEQRLDLRVDEAQRWWRDGVELTPFRGLFDVDLSVTPATNTLPLRRLELGVGEALEVTAAWVKFPELELEPLPQRYTHVTERCYRYESGTELVNFSAELQVDDVGLVTDYIMTNDFSGHHLGWTRVPKLTE